MQYKDGQRLQGSDGNIYVVRGGVPVRESAPAIGPSFGNDPKLPGALTGQNLSNVNAGVNARVNQATENSQIREAGAKASKAESEAAIAKLAGQAPGFDREGQLRKEFNALPVVKNFSKVVADAGGALRAPDSGQGDLQVLYAFAQVMDPDSVVRDSEQDLAKNTATVFAQLKQKYKMVNEESRLPDGVRPGLIESMRTKIGSINNLYGQQYKHYRNLATQYGLDPERVTGPYVGEVFQPTEEQYIRDSGGRPRSALAAPGSTFVTKNNPERSGFIDSLVRSGISFEQAQQLYRDRFPNAPVFADKAKWNEALDFARKHPNAAGSFGQSLDTVPLNQTDQDRNWFGQTTPGQVGTLYFNTAAGGLPEALAGDEGRQTVNEAHESLGRWGLVPEVVGAITGTLAANKALGGASNLLKGVPGIGKPFNFLANNPGARMLAADAGFGGIYGATQNPDNPLAGAAIGAGAGLAGNLIGSKVVAPGVRAGAAMAGFNPSPALPRAQNMFAAQIGKSNPDELIGRLQMASDLNMPIAPVDLAPQLRALGGSVTRKSPDAFAFADEALGARNLGQADRAIDLIDTRLAPSVDVPTFKANAKTSAQSASRDLYKRAEAHPSPDDLELADMLRTPAGEQAARNAYARALNNGEKVGDLSFEVDSLTGLPRVTGQPNWRTLHYIKMELDGMPEAESLRRRFVGRLGSLNPDYRAANAAYAKEIGKGDIVQAGYDAFNSRISPEQLAAGMKANEKSLPLYRQGFASAMSDTVDKTRLSADPYNMVYGSPRQQAKLGQLFPDGAPNFSLARGLESEMSLTNRELFGGSPTASRMEADKLFEGGPMGDILQAGLEVASGSPPISVARSKLFTGRAGFGGLRDAYRLGVGTKAQQRANELAPLLFNPNPSETLPTIIDLVAAKKARDEYVRRTGMFGAGVGAPLAIGFSN